MELNFTFSIYAAIHLPSVNKRKKNPVKKYIGCLFIINFVLFIHYSHSYTLNEGQEAKLDHLASISHSTTIPRTRKSNPRTACVPEAPGTALHREELTRELSTFLVPKGSALRRTHWRPLKIQAHGTSSQFPLPLI